MTRLFVYFYLWCFFYLVIVYTANVDWWNNTWEYYAERSSLIDEIFRVFGLLFVCLFYSCLIFTKKWMAYWLTVVSCLGSWGQGPRKRHIVWRPPLEGLSFGIAMRQRPWKPWLLWRPRSHAVHFGSSRGQVNNKNPTKATGRNHFHQRSGSMKVDVSRDTW